MNPSPCASVASSKLICVAPLELHAPFTLDLAIGTTERVRIKDHVFIKNVTFTADDPKVATGTTIFHTMSKLTSYWLLLTLKRFPTSRLNLINLSTICRATFLTGLKFSRCIWYGNRRGPGVDFNPRSNP